MKIKVPITDQAIVINKESVKAAAPAIIAITALGILDAALKDVSGGLTKIVIESGLQGFRFLMNQDS